MISTRLVLAVAICVSACAPELNEVAEKYRDSIEVSGQAEPQHFQVECPADLFPLKSVETTLTANDCRSSLDACIIECELGSAEHCLAAAFASEELESHGGTSLYLRACQLGAPSGCTNAAAYRFGQAERVADDCIVRSFKLACEHEDAWGCTMYGNMLGTGNGTTRDWDVALEMVDKACAIEGEDEEVCIYGLGVLEGAMFIED